MECDLTVFYHEDYLLHDPSPYTHPESPHRLEVAVNALEKLPCKPRLVQPPRERLETYSLVHSEEYLGLLSRLLDKGTVEFIDPDTYVSPGTRRAIERLAGAAVESVEIVSGGEGPTLILGRPPGHHTGWNGVGLGAPTQGFCIVNTSALLARLLSERGSVLVVDFDAHHGNGTQDILWRTPIPHIDLHQDYQTIYPGTGAPYHTGGEGFEGTKVNINLPPGAGDDIYSSAVRVVESAIEEFKPEYIVVSAGFDAYRGDTGFVSLNASSNTFHRIGEILSEYKGRVAIMLEGGYSLGLAKGLPAFLAGLLGHEDPIGDDETTSGPTQWRLYKERMVELSRAIQWIQLRSSNA